MSGQYHLREQVDTHSIGGLTVGPHPLTQVVLTLLRQNHGKCGDSRVNRVAAFVYGGSIAAGPDWQRSWVVAASTARVQSR